jgi:hypothetical protein
MMSYMGDNIKDDVEIGFLAVRIDPGSLTFLSRRLRKIE